MQTAEQRMSAPPHSVPLRSPARTAAIRNFAWLMLDKALAVVFGLAVFGLIARTLGPVASGHMAYGLALMQAALGMSLICSASVLLPRLYRMRHGLAGALANVFVVRLGGSLLGASVAALFALLAIDDPARLTVALVTLLAVPFIEPFYTAVAYWQSRNDNRRPTITRAAGLLTRAIVVVAAIAFGAPLWVVALAWVFEAIVAACLQYSSVRGVATLRTFVQRVSALRSTAYLRFGVRFLAGLWLANMFIRLDRLVLGQLMPAEAFGVYASAMQLVDVWLQVAYLIGFAAGPAFLYKLLAANGHSARKLWHVGAGLGGIGLVGLVGALLLGEFVMRLVFGARFVAGAPYLAAGAAFGVLIFVDQLVQIRLSAGNRPLAMTLKWAAACLAAVAVQTATFDSLGAYAGAVGLAVGVLFSWIVVWAALRADARDSQPPGERESRG